MTKSHIMYVTFLTFRDSIEKSNLKCPKVKENLNNLCKLFALNELMTDSSSCYEAGYFKVRSGQHIMDAIKSLMVAIRPQIIPLVEAFDVPESMIVSAIGNYYGDIYET